MGKDANAAVFELIAAQAGKKLPPLVIDPKFFKAVWEKNTAIMEKYNEPGRFTAFIGYEWTSNAGGGDNLHRNVIYRDGKAKADRSVPMTTFDSENPEDLWKWMAAWEERTGGSLLAIPHNGNLSNGKMFALTTFIGRPADARMGRERAPDGSRMYEITQIKGDGETAPRRSRPPTSSPALRAMGPANLAGVPKQPGMLAARICGQALQEGLKLEQELGANPFKFGFAGGTDTHTGLTTAEEDNFFGKSQPRSRGRPLERWEHAVINRRPSVNVMGWQMAGAGWTGVWATDNTREELWDAMKRRRPTRRRAADRRPLLRRLRLHDGGPLALPRGRAIPRASPWAAT